MSPAGKTAGNGRRRDGVVPVGRRRKRLPRAARRPRPQGQVAQMVGAVPARWASRSPGVKSKSLPVGDSAATVPLPRSSVTVSGPTVNVSLPAAKEADRLDRAVVLGVSVEVRLDLRRRQRRREDAQGRDGQRAAQLRAVAGLTQAGLPCGSFCAAMVMGKPGAVLSAMSREFFSTPLS